jgi:Na+/H+ antiporter NhaB
MGVISSSTSSLVRLLGSQVGAVGDVLGPVADALVRVEHEVGRAWHVVLALALAHVVLAAVAVVAVVRDVAVGFFAYHLVSCTSKNE